MQGPLAIIICAQVGAARNGRFFGNSRTQSRSLSNLKEMGLLRQSFWNRLYPGPPASPKARRSSRRSKSPLRPPLAPSPTCVRATAVPSEVFPGQASELFSGPQRNIESRPAEEVPSPKYTRACPTMKNFRNRPPIAINTELLPPPLVAFFFRPGARERRRQLDPFPPYPESKKLV